MAAAIRLSHQHSCSLDHLIGKREQLVGNFEVESLRGLEIDHKLELGRLHDREIGRLLSFENAASVNAGLTIRIRNDRAVAHQPAGRSELAPFVYRGNRMARRQHYEFLALGVEEWIGSDNERTGPLLDEGCEGCAELAFGG